MFLNPYRFGSFSIVSSGQTIFYTESMTAGNIVGSVQTSLGLHDAFRFADTQSTYSSDGYYQINSAGQLSLTTIGAENGIDPFWSNVVFASNFNGRPGSTTDFFDQSSTNKSIVVSGNTVISTTQSRSGGTSAFFDGTGDYLTIPTSTDFNVGDGSDWTVEGWFFPVAITKPPYLFHLYATAAVRTAIQIELDRTLTFFISGSILTNTTATTANLNSWNHYALMKSGTRIWIYLNGILVYNASPSPSITSRTDYKVELGTSFSASGTAANDFNGYMTGFRMTRGVARYPRFVPQTTKFAESLAFDPSFANVSLLVHGDGAVGSSVITSAGNFAHTFTTIGTPVLSVAVRKIGSACMAFVNNNPASATGNSAWVTANTTDLTLGSSDFTIECWVYPLAYGGGVIAKQRSVATSGDWIVSVGASGASFSCTTGGEQASFNMFSAFQGGSVPLNLWTHIAITREGSLFSIWVNGVQVTTASSASAITSTASGLTIGSSKDDGAFGFKGYVDEVRITKGSARYTSNFTPPPALALVGPDPYYSSVSTLVRADGVIRDDSISVKPYSVVGAASIATNISKFGTSSMFFPSAGAHYSTPTHADFQFGAGNFTVECWIYPTAYLTGFPVAFNAHLIGLHQSGVSNLWIMMLSQTGNASFFNFTGFSLVGTSTIPLNAWTHIAVCRSGTTTALFVNGIREIFGTDSNNYGAYASPFTIGGDSTSAANAQFTGYIDEVRVTKGVARYVNNFLAPKSPMLTWSKDQYESSVSLYLKGDGTNASNLILDNSLGQKAVTANGNAKLSTAQYRRGTASISLDGATTSFFSTPLTTDLQLGTSDFTIEMWVYMTSTPGAGAFATLISCVLDTPQGGWRIFIDQNRLAAPLSTYYSGTAPTATLNASTAIPLSVWTHIAWVRSGTRLITFVNGTRDAESSIPLATGVIASTAANLEFGRSNSAGNAPTWTFTGFIDQLRITKGVGRYTNNFNPTLVTAAFSGDSGTNIYGPETAQRTYPVQTGSGGTYTSAQNVMLTIADGTPAYPQRVLFDSPVMYYRMNETSGTSAFNLGTLGASGTYSGTFTLNQTGFISGGASVFFNASASTKLNTSVTTDYTSAFTMECWVRAAASGHDPQGFLIGKAEFAASAAANFPVRLWYFDSTKKVSLRLSKGDDLNDDLQLDSATTLLAGVDYHIVCVYRATGLVELWINGTLDNSSTINFTINAAATIPWTIGTPTEAGAGIGNSTFAGNIGEVAIYNYALSSTKISAHYNYKFQP